mgnify:CR=1 FL=1
MSQSRCYIAIDFGQQLIRHHHVGQLFLPAYLYFQFGVWVGLGFLLPVGFRPLFHPTTTFILLLLILSGESIAAVQALATITAFQSGAFALTILLFTTGFLAIATLAQNFRLLCIELAFNLRLECLGIFITRMFVLVMFIIVVASHTNAILGACDSLRKAFAIHLETPGLFAMASLFLGFGLLGR